MKKKIIGNVLNTLAILALASGVFFFTAAGSSASEGKTEIEAINEMYFDGENLSMTYTIISHCKAGLHGMQVEFEPETVDYRDTEKVKSLRAVLYDVVQDEDEEDCDVKEKEITVKAKVDLNELAGDEAHRLVRKGLVMDPDYGVKLPAVRLGASTGAFKDKMGSYDSHYSKPNKPAPVSTVQVAMVEYSPIWKCKLYKNDGARKDGFTGTGNTVEEARRSASVSCKSTNNPNCDAYSQDSSHTSCVFDLQETETVKEFRSDNLPANAQTVAWNCSLKKNDGSRKNEFSGSGATQEEARAEAARYCRGTNHPDCDKFSLDDDHTSCSQTMKAYGPKPEAMWKCTLWKNDGARKDGFTGTGKTELDARNGAASGCRGTNNPNCGVWSTDPAHTNCNIELVYPK